MATKFNVANLVGVRIKDIRLAKPSESGLDGTVVLELWNGMNLVILGDSEGNQPGVIQVQFPDNTTAYVGGWVFTPPRTARDGVHPSARCSRV